MMNKKLLLRVFSALILVIFCIWAIFATTEFVFLMVSFALGLVGIIEYYLIVKKNSKLNIYVLLISNILMFSGVWFLFNKNNNLFLLIFAGVLLLNIGIGFFVKNAFKWHIIPAIWISFPFCLLFWLKVSFSPNIASQFIWLLLLMVSINDIAAYFGGKSFGKTLLAPQISPKKTKEGSLFGILGGLAGAIISIYLLDWFYAYFQIADGGPQLKELIYGWKLIVLVLIVIPAAQVGDLIESKLKRAFSVKDSSNFIPGHGGFLDRYDAYLVAIPTFFILLIVFEISG